MLPAPTGREHDFARCDALASTARTALAEAGLSLDDLSFFDFYSCFPVAVEMACQMLGLAEEDPRGLTLTGGLPYAGGPGNNYTLHSLAVLFERLRERPGASGLVTGNGWYLTKHSATVLCSAPREDAPGPPSREAEPDPPEDTRSTRPVQGRGEVETYTVVHDRDGAPTRGIVLGRTGEGRRLRGEHPERPPAAGGFRGGRERRSQRRAQARGWAQCLRARLTAVRTPFWCIRHRRNRMPPEPSELGNVNRGEQS